MLTDQRKRYYELLHPETAQGGDHKSESSRQFGDLKTASDTKRFTQDTADNTGNAERSVQRDAERGEKIMPAAMMMIVGSKLDTGTFLDKIKNLPNDEQVAFVKQSLKAPAPKKAKSKKPKAPAVNLTLVIDTDEDQFEALKRASIQLSAAVADASPEVRSRYFAWQNEQENHSADVADTK